MPFDGLGQALCDDVKMVTILDVYITLVDNKKITIDDAAKELYISKEDFEIVAAQKRLFDKSDKDKEYRQFMDFGMIIITF